MRGICTADWHLDGMNKVLGGNATQIQMKELRKPFLYALEHGIQNVFIPGDASDTPQMSDDAFIAFITLLLTFDKDLCIWYDMGNHDVHSKGKNAMNVLKTVVDAGLFENFKLLGTVEVEKVDGIYVAHVPYPHEQVPECRRPPLVFAHTETMGAIGDNGHPLRTKREQIKRQPGDFVISGHIHQYQHLKKKRWVYCGSPYQKNFGESLPKGFIEFEALYVDGKLRVSHDFVDSKPQFILQTVIIKDKADWERLKDNPSIRYKLMVDRNEVTLPKNITTKFPNIVSINGIDTTNKVEMAGIEVNLDGLTVKNLPKISMTTGLTSYLRQTGLSKPKRELARDLVKQAISELHLTA